MGANIGQSNIGVSTGSAINVTGTFTSSCPAPAATQTIIQKTGNITGAGAGTTTLYTVTGGKTLYVTSMSFGKIYTSTAATAQLIEIKDNATALLTFYDTPLSGLNWCANVLTFTFPSPVAFTNTVKLTTNVAAGTTNIPWSFSGWEQ